MKTNTTIASATTIKAISKAVDERMHKFLEKKEDKISKLKQELEKNLTFTPVILTKGHKRETSPYHSLNQYITNNIDNVQEIEPGEDLDSFMQMVISK